MEERGKEEFEFIKEKIIERPVNKKRLLKHGIYTVGFAVLFGTTACFVFTMLYPRMENWLHPKEDPMIAQPKEEWDAEAETTESEELLAEEETVVETEAEELEPETEMPQAIETTIKQELEIADYQKLQEKLYEKGKSANRSVVTVVGVVSNTDRYDAPYEVQKQAAGIILEKNDSELLILTEYEIVKEADEIRVTFIDEKTVPASKKQYDSNTGIAVLSVALTDMAGEARDRFQAASWEDSRGVSQGDIAIAISSPLGMKCSIDTGQITSVGNVIQRADAVYSVFTTNIVGNGSSSGILFNIDEEMIGLVVQGDSGNGTSHTLTAISITELKDVVNMLLDGSEIPYLGLIVEKAEKGQMAEKPDTLWGVRIKKVVLDSPALEAGLQIGDIILEINEEKIRSIEAYKKAILSSAPGEQMKIVVSREGTDERLDVEHIVTVGSCSNSSDY